MRNKRKIISPAIQKIQKKLKREEIGDGRKKRKEKEGEMGKEGKITVGRRIMDIEGRKEVKDEKGAERDEKEQRKGVKTLKEMFEIRGGRAKNQKLRKNMSNQEKR